MLIARAFKYELDPNNQQRTRLFCGLEMDRDLNAACNLVAASWTETENACGEDVRLVADSVGSAEQTSMNQEPNINQGH